MADDHNVDSQGDEEEADEALSLSDLPLNTDIDEPAADDEEEMNNNINDDEEDKHPKKTTFHISSSSNCRSISSASSSSEPTTDLFEFFSDLSSEMSHAEDIIFRGKLKPFINNIDQQQYCSLSNQTTTTQQHNNNNYYKPAASINNNNNSVVAVDDKLQSFHRRRSGSMSDLNISSTSRSNSTDLSTASRLLMRNSRSLDYQKLRRTTSLETTSTSDQIQRNSSGKNICCGKSSDAGQKLSRPRWHILMFGLLKFPPEMELRDIKKRQVRRNHSAAMFPTSFEDAGQKVPVNRSTDRKSSWGLLKVLSCKGNASVAVTASFGCMP